MPDAHDLTPLERDALAMSGKLANLVYQIVLEGGDDSSIYHDWSELASAIHVVQHAVAANATARAHPDLLRPLGDRFQEVNDA